MDCDFFSHRTAVRNHKRQSKNKENKFFKHRDLMQMDNNFIIECAIHKSTEEGHILSPRVKWPIGKFAFFKLMRDARNKKESFNVMMVRYVSCSY
jgi:hypothetical protein